jgi:hypothetical protein
MKTLAMMMLGLVVLQNANADVICSVIRKSDEHGIVHRGVRVYISGTKFSDAVWFGTSESNRDAAAVACREIVAKTNCHGITPRAEDQYLNVGDVGFGPQHMVQGSTKAGLLNLMPVASSLKQHLPDDYSSQHKRYFAYYDQCEEERASLAMDVMENMQSSQEAARRQKILNNQSTSVQMWDKL